MAIPKINNVRVHVWTKSELRETEKQLKAGNFIMEKKGDLHYAYDTNKWGEKICIFSALVGFPSNMVTVRLDESYFDYSN